MIFKIQPYSLQELGKRKNQEDSLFPALGKSTADDRLFILCDGMGGHEKGEVASATVCETMSKTILSQWNPDQPFGDDLLQQALSDAYDALDAKDNGEVKKMGTTLTFVCLHAEGATVAHIGDSRIYQLRPAANGEPARIVFRTRDHSLVEDLVKIGEITEEEAKDHPQKNVITRAMQPCQERRSRADIKHLTDILPGDYFYMCSDGMLEETSDENLLFIITNNKHTDEQKIEMLRNVTEENKDNHTAHLIHICDVEGATAAEEKTSAEPKGVLVTPDSVMDNSTATPASSSEPTIPSNPARPVQKGKSPIIPILIAVIALLCAVLAFFLLSKGSENSDGQDAEKQPTELKQQSKKITKHKANVKEVVKSAEAAPQNKEEEAKDKPVQDK